MSIRRLAAFLLLTAAASYFVLSARSGAVTPERTLDPLAVVQIQLAALRESDESGIRTAFRFASPQNRAVTGPFDHFSQMVHSEPYRALLRHRSAEVAGLYDLEGAAAIPVFVVAGDGSRHAFMFLLSQQQDGEWAGCWMTDGVIPHPLPESPNPII